MRSGRAEFSGMRMALIERPSGWVEGARAGVTMAPRLLIVLGISPNAGHPRMLERNHIVRLHRPNEARSRIKGWGCLTAVLLGIAGLCDPNFAVAADARGGGDHRVAVDRADRTVTPGVRRGIVARRSEMPPGGTVVLRGSRPANPPGNANVEQPTLGVSGEGYGSTANRAAGVALPPGGIDLGNMGGFDFSGLNPPASAWILGR